MRYYIFLLFTLFYFYGSAQQTKYVDFTKLKAEIKFDTLQKSVKGNVTVQFKVLQKTNTVFLDARKFKEVTPINLPNTINLTYAKDKITFTGNFKADKEYTLNFAYKTQPKKALYFWGWQQERLNKNAPNHKQIWTQGQGKYTSNWLPSIDDMNDKLLFDLSYTFNKDYQVIANGKLISAEEKNEHLKTWHYQTSQPMCSYLVALIIGKYHLKTSESTSGITLENYIYKDRIEDFEPTYRYHKEIFDFLETEIGVPYPWSKVYRQVPVRDFLHAGMENTGCTTFSDDFIIDKKTFDDINFVNVSAHELAHQWFGNLITETNSKHHWLHEGFATYYALQTEKKLFGYNQFHFKLYENAESLEAQNAKKKSTPLVTEKGNSLTYYQHGAWALVALENEIGSKNFKKVVKQFLNTYAFKNVTTEIFLKVATETSGKDLTNYAKIWLYGAEFPTKEALDILTQSNFMQNYLALAGQRTQPMIGKYVYLSESLDFPVNSYLGQEVIIQLQGEAFTEQNLSLYKKAFNTNDPIIEQTLANSLAKIPQSLEPRMRKLLKASSYATTEAALYNLWNNFEANKMEYLKITKDIDGFNAKNIRTLWLALALNTPGFSTTERESFFKELQSYTATNCNMRLRQNAFQYLEILEIFTDANLIDLSFAATHPNWQFNKYCTQIIERLLNKEKYKTRFSNLQNKLPNKIQQLITNHK